MPLIKSISGIRGTIGGRPGKNLTAQDIVECSAAFGQWARGEKECATIVVGRDGRMSGPWVRQLVVETLLSLGVDVIDLGLSTTPTVEMAVKWEKADGAIILTASHNPKEWNALKFLNSEGEFISAAAGQTVLDLIDSGEITYAGLGAFGKHLEKEGYIEKHIDSILDLPLVDTEAIRAKQFKVVVDAVNSTGGISVPPLLEKLGCEVIVLNGEPTGDFAHNPEPLPKNLRELSQRVAEEQADLGIAVDPDVDRLALICEDGSPFGEEYTLVAVADYVLGHKKGDTVSNLSSTRALREVTEKHGGAYHASAVGEVNVVAKMKEVDAVIGGEGNGGVIVPELHYGRDALAGIALFLSHLAHFDGSLSDLKRTYPQYVMEKDKIALTEDVDLPVILERLQHKYQHEQCDTTDGLKIDFEQGWVHLRKSNTEPIIRIYSESVSEKRARALAHQMKVDIEEMT